MDFKSKNKPQKEFKISEKSKKIKKKQDKKKKEEGVVCFDDSD